MSFFVPTRFVWRFGGRQVHLCGSFTRWVETVPVTPVEDSPGVFTVVVHLPPGYHQYKFIVDGKWRHDETAPFMPDPLGNVNNWLFVRRIEQSPSQPSSTSNFEAPLAAAQPQPGPQQPAAVAPRAESGTLPPSSPLPAAATGTGPNWQNSISSTPLTGPLPVAAQGDVDMASAEAIVAPIVVHNPKEPEYTQKKVADFLHSHTAYELIPESGKVVLLDVDLPFRQAFHALHEQGISSAPLWDGAAGCVVGVISSSDFIGVLTRLHRSVAAGASPLLSDDEMDGHSIRALRAAAAAAAADGAGPSAAPKPLVYAVPDQQLGKVVATLSANKCSMAPILSCDPNGSEQPCVLHLCTLSGVLACLMRHFRASLASLPLLAQPLSSLPLGTWSPDASVAHTDVMPDSKDRRQWKKLQPLHTVTLDTPLTAALNLLLDTGVSALPVVDEQRRLVDLYSRSDITQLAQNQMYKHLQWDGVTVRQALALPAAAAAAAAPQAAAAAPPPVQPATAPSAVPLHPMLGGLSASLNAAAAAAAAAAAQPPPSAVSSRRSSVLHAGPGPGGRGVRVHVCSKDDALRSVVERLAIPGVRRLVVVQPETRRVEGVVSLSDVASYLFL